MGCESALEKRELFLAFNCTAGALFCAHGCGFLTAIVKDAAALERWRNRVLVREHCIEISSRPALPLDGARELIKPAKAIAKYGDQPWGKVEPRKLNLPPPPYLRKTFDVNKPIARATVYASALGIYELHINGQRVGRDHFTPGWTDYAKRVHNQTYDVTPMLKVGANAIGAVL